MRAEPAEGPPLRQAQGARLLGDLQLADQVPGRFDELGVVSGIEA